MTGPPHLRTAPDGQTSRTLTHASLHYPIHPRKRTLRFSSTVHSIPSAIRHLTLISPIALHPGKTLWLYGAIGRTEEWNQPVSRYILDNRYVSTITAEVKNDTSYNELLVYFCDLDSSSHTLIVENTNEGATLFLDYYLVKPIPPESPRPTGTLQTGGKPFSTSITERPIYFGNNVNLSGNAAIGSLLGAVAGGILLALVIAVVAFIFWRRRGGSKPYYYQPAAAHDVLFDGTH